MDTATTSIAIGLIVSLLFTEFFGLTSGGMIVPGYLALYWSQPSRIIMTLIAALITYLIVIGLANFIIVYGRRRIALMVLFGFLIGTALSTAVAALPMLSSSAAVSLPDCFCVIGFIIPGLIALWMDRQGIVQTLGPLMTSSVIVRLVLIVIGMETLV